MLATLCPYFCIHCSTQGVQAVVCWPVQLFQLHGLSPTRLLCSWDSLLQEYWRGLPCPPPGDPPDPGIEPASLMSPALAGGFFSISATWKGHAHQQKMFPSLPLWFRWLPLAMRETWVRTLGWEGKGYPLQYSGLENSMDTTIGVAKSRPRLNDFHFTSLQLPHSWLPSSISSSSLRLPLW